MNSAITCVNPESINRNAYMVPDWIPPEFSSTEAVTGWHLVQPFFYDNINSWSFVQKNFKILPGLGAPPLALIINDKRAMGISINADIKNRQSINWLWFLFLSYRVLLALSRCCIKINFICPESPRDELNQTRSNSNGSIRYIYIPCFKRGDCIM